MGETNGQKTKETTPFEERESDEQRFRVVPRQYAALVLLAGVSGGMIPLLNRGLNLIIAILFSSFTVLFIAYTVMEMVKMLINAFIDRIYKEKAEANSRQQKIERLQTEVGSHLGRVLLDKLFAPMQDRHNGEEKPYWPTSRYDLEYIVIFCGNHEGKMAVFNRPSAGEPEVDIKATVEGHDLFITLQRTKADNFLLVTLRSRLVRQVVECGLHALEIYDVKPFTIVACENLDQAHTVLAAVRMYGLPWIETMRRHERSLRAKALKYNPNSTSESASTS